MEDVGIGILLPFGIFYGYLKYFSRFGMLYRATVVVFGEWFMDRVARFFRYNMP
jgi:hypothetical protein